MGRGDRARGGMPPEPDRPPVNGAGHSVVVETRATCIEVRYFRPSPFGSNPWHTLQLDGASALLLAEALGVAHDAHARASATEVEVVRGR